MVSVLRQLQAEWNSLVPAAQAQGIRRVRMLNAPLEPIAYRREKLEWLRQQLGLASAQMQTSAPAVVAATTDFVDEYTFGVEIECYLPRSITRAVLAARITAAGVNCSETSYDHITRSHWRIVTDGSLGNYTQGIEVVSPILRGSDGFSQLEKVLRVMKTAGCKINRRCGFHVHVGVGATVAPNTIKALVRSYSTFEPVIDTFLAPSRRGSENSYCAPVRYPHSSMSAVTTVDQVVQAYGQTPGRLASRGMDRYRKLNLKPLSTYGTVEFRQHQGTVEIDRARNWTMLCLLMVRQAAREDAQQTIATSTANLDGLMSAIQAPADVRRFFRARQEYFASNVHREDRRRAA